MTDIPLGEFESQHQSVRTLASKHEDAIVRSVALSWLDSFSRLRDLIDQIDLKQHELDGSIEYAQQIHQDLVLYGRWLDDNTGAVEETASAKGN